MSTATIRHLHSLTAHSVASAVLHAAFSFRLCFVYFAIFMGLNPLVATTALGADEVLTGSKSLAMQSTAPATSKSESPQNKANGSSKDRAASGDSISAETEQSILDFAKREEPQLFELLRFLKQKQPTSYRQALRETGQTQQRLETLRERDKELHELETQLWRTRSKLSLLAAQMSVKENDELDKQLEALVRELDQQEIAKIQLMRERTAKQLEKWDSQLKERTSPDSTSIDKSLESWKSRIKKQRNSRKKSPE